MGIKSGDVSVASQQSVSEFYYIDVLHFQFYIYLKTEPKTGKTHSVSQSQHTAAAAHTSKMFSFFKRSKKDTETHNGPKENKDKKSKDKDSSKENTASPSRKQKEMCKNNSTPQNFESAPQCASVTNVPTVATEVAGPKTLEIVSASASGAKIPAEVEIIDPNPTNETSDLQNTMEFNGSASNRGVASRAQMYGNMLKSLEPIREGRGGGVKPCGHGTVAVSPKIPILQAAKRDNSNTPPESPKQELKFRLTSKPDQISESISTKATELRKTEESGTKDNLYKDMNDTVTGVMKLRVDVPIITTTPPIDDMTPPINDTNITDAEKYVISKNS